MLISLRPLMNYQYVLMIHRLVRNQLVITLFSSGGIGIIDYIYYVGHALSFTSGVIGM